MTTATRCECGTYECKCPVPASETCELCGAAFKPYRTESFFRIETQKGVCKACFSLVEDRDSEHVALVVRNLWGRIRSLEKQVASLKKAKGRLK